MAQWKLGPEQWRHPWTGRGKKRLLLMFALCASGPTGCNRGERASPSNASFQFGRRGVDDVSQRETFAGTANAPTAISQQPPAPRLEFLGRWNIELVAPVWELGATSDLGNRRIIPITGGDFEGPTLKGKILNNGADWQVVTKDGVAIIDTRYLLQTDDGALIYLQTNGYRHGPAEVLAKVARGEVVDPGSYYFRITMRFETSSPRYQYLNNHVALASAMRLGKAVVYDAYLVK